MRRVRAVLAVLTTVFLSLLVAGLAGSAAAGGPTSVLLVVPGERRTASLYIGEPDYQQLVELVGAYDTPNRSTTPPPGADNDGGSGTNDMSGPGVTLTWLMHDVTVWRVDRVFLAADGGPLISTRTTLDGSDLWSKPPTWHNVAANGKALSQLLDQLGVGNAGADVDQAASRTGRSGAASPSAAAPAAAAASTSADRTTGTAGPDGWLAGPLGLLLGVGLTLAASRWRAARVTTGEPAAVELPSVESRPPTETLSSHPSR